MPEQSEWQAVDFALVAEAVMPAIRELHNAAIRELHERGGIDDVFGRLPDEVEPPLTNS